MLLNNNVTIIDFYLQLFVIFLCLIATKLNLFYLIELCFLKDSSEIK